MPSRVAKSRPPSPSAYGRVEEVCASAGYGVPQKTFEQYLNSWLMPSASLADIFKRCRELAGRHNYMQWVCGLRQTFYGAGCSLQGDDTFLKDLGAARFKRLARDAWTEYLACDNVVAVWREAKGNEAMPQVVIFDCEAVKYSDEFGAESLKVRLPQKKLSPSQGRALGTVFMEAYANGGWVTLSERRGEYFKVLSRAKVGQGLATPRMQAAFLDLCIYDMLRQGDHNGAWARKSLLRHTKKGHEQRYGSAAGSAINFFRKAFGDRLLKRLAATPGFSEFVSNFDIAIDYVYLKPEFFDKKTLETTMERLDRWAGPAGLLLRHGAEASSNPWLMQLFRAEGEAERSVLGGFLQEILEHESFGRHKPVKVTFDDTVWFNLEQLQKWLQWAQSSGLMSPQTARGLMNLDNERESALLLEAHNNPKQYTPPFEAKQGLLQSDGGRPKEKDPPAPNV